MQREPIKQLLQQHYSCVSVCLRPGPNRWAFFVLQLLHFCWKSQNSRAHARDPLPRVSYNYPWLEENPAARRGRVLGLRRWNSLRQPWDILSQSLVRWSLQWPDLLLKWQLEKAANLRIFVNMYTLHGESISFRHMSINISFRQMAITVPKNLRCCKTRS